MIVSTGTEERGVKILQIYNQYRSLFGGEETVVLKIAELVTKNGGEARLAMRTSRGLDESFQGKLKAFFSGIYNPFSFREIAGVLKDFAPDLVHVHNLNPLYSPSVLVGLKRAGLPVVMTVHNHFHTCPTADHLHSGVVCERCLGGREYWCILQNCRGSIFESAAYASRSLIARVLGLYTDNISLVIALNEFGKIRLSMAGFDPERIVVIPNMVDIPELRADPSRGRYAIFSGRICVEKGVYSLVSAASLAPDVEVRVMGSGAILDDLMRHASPNVRFLGQLDQQRVQEELRGARFLVFPSIWFEGCPLAVLEAMAIGLPIIASRIGGIPELVEDGETGLLFEPGNVRELAQKMTELWNDPERCSRMGMEARRKAQRNHSETTYWESLRAAYSRVGGCMD
jgi:glycosyltransferase involved in cell wall biosynthesis